MPLGFPTDEIRSTDPLYPESTKRTGHSKTCPSLRRRVRLSTLTPENTRLQRKKKQKLKGATSTFPFLAYADFFKKSSGRFNTCEWKLLKRCASCNCMFFNSFKPSLMYSRAVLRHFHQPLPMAVSIDLYTLKELTARLVEHCGV